MSPRKKTSFGSSDPNHVHEFNTAGYCFCGERGDDVTAAETTFVDEVPLPSGKEVSAKLKKAPGSHPPPISSERSESTLPAGVTPSNPTKDEARDGAERSARAAIASTEANSPASWRRKAFGALESICLTMERFTVDDVWARMGLDRDKSDATVTPSAMGGILTRAKGFGWCSATQEFQKSERTTHHHESRIWTSNIKGAKP